MSHYKYPRRRLRSLEPEIQAKPTEYKGHKFRSRLEARWAVFFDALDIQYHYELQDFDLGHCRYLPDFYLPNFDGGAWAEVKFAFEGGEKGKCMDLCVLTGRIVLLLEGMPNFNAIEYYWPNGLEGAEKSVGVIAHGATKYGERMFAEPGFRTLDGQFEPGAWFPDYTDAVFAARGAQFEFLDR
jgi:hypothetical protein